jgi:flagellar hook-basal body complex protein FliE
MFIVPMNSSIDLSKINSFISEFNKLSGQGDAGAPSSSGFREMFQGLVEDVERTEAVAEEDAYKLAVGQLDDPHTAMINAAKAELTLSTLVQIRNKALDAYSEIMRVSL